jgi:uncharacterized protein YegJ (DUF2314 family)
MEAAIDSARATVAEAIRRTQSPPRGQTYLGLKVPLSDGASREHVWLHAIRFERDSLHGQLVNEPVVVDGRVVGEIVSVAPSAITDWMAVDSGRLCGAFTVWLLRSRNTPEERVLWQREMGITAPDEAC